MKKVITTLAIITLVGCGAAKTEIKDDSTKIVVDTLKVDSIKLDTLK